jgi:ribA/ribD-fused uncharacterized protein
MPYKLDTDEAVYFYEPEFYVLSNFSAFRVLWRGVDFDTAEHAYQWEKFYDVAEGEPSFPIQRAIQDARSAHAAFKLAETHAHLRHPQWDQFKLTRMRAILEAKLAQHEYVQRKLLETDTRLLIEDSWRDAYWGWGPQRDGCNMLGILWMTIRRNVREKEPAHA